jgi:deoxycytidylate deaminase
MMAAAGIRRVAYHFDYNNDPLVAELLGEAGVTIEQF